MNSSFKYIVIAIICSLTAVFIWQLFWLKGLYKSIEEEISRDLISCIEKADLAELQLRIDSLEKKTEKEKKTQKMTFSASISTKEDSISKQREQSSTRQVITEQDTVTTSSTEDSEVNLTDFEVIRRRLTLALHEALDSIAPIQLNVLDSILVTDIQNRGINAQVYYTEIVDLNSDSILKTSQRNSFLVRSKQSYIYKFDTERELAYRVYTEPLTKSIFVRMSGILGTTLLIIIILGFAFWYLIRTVMRQKTLEEMKDDFTNNMTHELKTPIAMAYSATDALLNFKQGDDKAKRDKYLRICKDQLSELTGLVEQILSMSMERRKTFVLNKEDIPIRDMLDILVDQHRLKSEKDIAFHVNVNPEDFIIRADRTHLSNMVSNLIDNAIKYSKAAVEIKIDIYRKDKQCVIAVEDNGIGITNEKQHYIFDKFYRVTDGNHYEVKGYGLGLFYVKTMAEKHGGSISVSSAPGKGSIFTIKIPV